MFRSLSQRARNRSHTDIVENDLTASRSAFLSGASVAATVILGLYSAGLWKEIMLPLLAIDITVGLIAFAVYNDRKKKARALILTMDTGYFVAADKLADLNSLFIKETYRIEEIDEERIYFFWAYLAFASLAVRVYLIDIFDDMSKAKPFRSIKSRLLLYLNLQKQLVKKAHQVYVDQRSPWNYDGNKYNADLEKLNTYIEEFFKYDERKERAIEKEKKEKQNKKKRNNRKKMRRIRRNDKKIIVR
jgi:hypothetical protein